MLLLAVVESRKKRKHSKRHHKHKADAPATSDAMQQQIRNRGTFYLSFTDVDDRVYANGTLVNPPKPADAKDAKGDAKGDAKKAKKLLKASTRDGKREV
jgi:hypothetical protein